jgi:hypothetical protein
VRRPSPLLAAAAAGAPTTPLAARARAAITGRDQPSTSLAGRNRSLENKTRRQPRLRGVRRRCRVSSSWTQPCRQASSTYGGSAVLLSTSLRSQLPPFASGLCSHSDCGGGVTVVCVPLAFFLCFVYFPFLFFLPSQLPIQPSFPPQRAKWELPWLLLYLARESMCFIVELCSVGLTSVSVFGCKSLRAPHKFSNIRNLQISLVQVKKYALHL